MRFSQAENVVGISAQNEGLPYSQSYGLEITSVLPRRGPLKRVASNRNQATRVKLLFFRMSLSRNRFQLSGDML